MQPKATQNNYEAAILYTLFWEILNSVELNIHFIRYFCLKNLYSVFLPMRAIKAAKFPQHL